MLAPSVPNFSLKLFNSYSKNKCEIRDNLFNTDKKG